MNDTSTCITVIYHAMIMSLTVLQSIPTTTVFTYHLLDCI